MRELSVKRFRTSAVKVSTLLELSSVFEDIEEESYEFSDMETYIYNDAYFYVARNLACKGYPIVGYAIVIPPYKDFHNAAHLDTINVVKASRCKGVGRSIMEAVMKDFLNINLFVASVNAGAIRFYERLGFTKQFEIPYYYDYRKTAELEDVAPWSDAIFMANYKHVISRSFEGVEEPK
jgi:ribosomal protein S18 acetylase RimI-like enzyme